MTCTPEAKTNEKKRAGICLGCSYLCHSGHELIELYTKRNFRCDCGTSKYLTTSCKYDSNKSEDNDSNQYNHNFSGIYCICKRPYPDPENDNEDEMIQCIVCEDWYHSGHLETDDVPDGDDYQELICAACMRKNEFLQYYSHLCVKPNSLSKNNSVNVAEASDIKIDVEEKELKTTENKSEDSQTKAAEEIKTDAIVDANVESKVKESTIIESAEAGPSTSVSSESPPLKRQKLDESLQEDKSTGEVNCKKPKTIWNSKNGATFWPNNWRNDLCTCDDCQKIYKDLQIEFLIDTEDTLQYYAEKGKAKGRSTTQEMLMNAVSKLDHVSKIEVITGFNHFKSKLTEFLSSDKDVITENDVRDFFRNISEASKK